MVNYALKKLGYHFAICLIAWFLILKFSPYTGIYAGWFSGFLSACYLLAGWLAYLKSKGTDFGKLLRRKKPPETPYYLRNAAKSASRGKGSTVRAMYSMTILRRLRKNKIPFSRLRCATGQRQSPLP